MTIKVLVMDEQPDSYEHEKKGKIEQWKIMCLDWSEGLRCKTMLEYQLPADLWQYKGAFKDRFCELTVTEIRPGFGGSMRVNGSISVVASDPQPAPETLPEGKQKAA